MKLIIVESPTKAKTISRFLGKKYKVESSYGHLRDLPKKKIGVDVKDDFKPTYIAIPKAKKRITELKKLVKRLNIEKKVIFLEWVETVYPYLKKSDCFVLSSLYEGLPMVLIETLSQSTPIISPDCISGPREALAPELKLDEKLEEYPYFGKYGILTKPFEDNVVFKTLEKKSLSEEEEVLAKTMLYIRENNNIRKKYSNGLERAKDFNINNIIKNWEAIF